MLIAIEASHANKPKKTGVENYCWHIIQELKKQIPSSERVILYSATPLAGALGDLPPNWRAKILRWPFKKLWSQVRLSAELLLHPPDVFFAPGQLIPFFCPEKLAVTIHDSAFMAYPEAYHFWGRQYLKWMNKRILKKAAFIVTPSEFSKNELNKYYKAGGGKAAVVPEACDENVFSRRSEDENFFKTYSISRPYIMSLGRLEEKKNTAGIIRAFEILKKGGQNENLKLVLAGSPGVGYDKIKQAIENSPFRADILCVGWVNEADAAALLSHASAFVFPSFYEGFGLPVLEAMACGCPVVASTGNSLGEVGGDAALYADPADSAAIAARIGLLLRDPVLRAEKISRGLQRVKNFSWQKTAQATWEKIKSLP